MSCQSLGSALAASCALFAAAPAWAEQIKDTALTNTIIVTAARTSARTTNAKLTDSLDAPEQIALPADAAAIAARVPGGALIGNGALSGQFAYRGLAGERVLSTINGQRFATGGPNAMDPPLHYAPSLLVERLEITRGTAPVSDGPGLAATVNAVLVETRFTNSAALAPQARAAAQYRSVDNSYALGGTLGAANNRWRLGLTASKEQGDDYKIPGGTAKGTSFERNLYGVQAGFQTKAGELFLEYRRSETHPTGNPPFALDIVYFNTDFLQAGFRGDIAENLNLVARAGHVAVRHLMDNQTLRSAPPMLARATFADADTSTADLTLRFGTPENHVKIGADLEITDKFVRITNPANPAFFLDAQPRLTASRTGAFVEYRAAAGALAVQLGARLDHTTQSAGIPQLGAAVPQGPRSLAATFINADREKADTTFDVVLQSWLNLGQLTPRLTLARKTRVPSLLERFAWLPTEASFGLADGNIYVGNLDLKPETAWSAELGIDIETSLLTLRPSVFYKRIDNYIQGTPFDATPGLINTPTEMVAAMNGDPTPLIFTNVDAHLYGADLDLMLRPLKQLELTGTASVVRAKRRDLPDNLYRIAPATFRLAAVWRGSNFALGTELIAAAAQNRVSATNSEDANPGYAVLGLFGNYALTKTLRAEAGLENIFNTYYQPHLAGKNRLPLSDVPQGGRLPGPGRGGWVRLTAAF